MGWRKLPASYLNLHTVNFNIFQTLILRKVFNMLNSILVENEPDHIFCWKFGVEFLVFCGKEAKYKQFAKPRKQLSRTEKLSIKSVLLKDTTQRLGKGRVGLSFECVNDYNILLIVSFFVRHANRSITVPRLVLLI